MRFSRPQQGYHQPNSRWPGIIKFFPARESLRSDIPAGDGKIANPFLQCSYPPPYEQRFFHHDGMYAKNWSLPLYVYSLARTFRSNYQLELAIVTLSEYLYKFSKLDRYQCFLFFFYINYSTLLNTVSHSTVSGGAGIEARTVATSPLAARCFNHAAISHPHSAIDLIHQLG